jgi:hypothetical protein
LVSAATILQGFAEAAAKTAETMASNISLAASDDDFVIAI